MKGKYILTDRKLSDEEFKKKYYVKGLNQQQFHTMDLSDGVDERQQLLINNDRALWERMDWIKDHYFEEEENRTKQLSAIRKATRTATIICIMAAILCLFTLFKLWN